MRNSFKYVNHTEMDLFTFCLVIKFLRQRLKNKSNKHNFFTRKKIVIEKINIFLVFLFFISKL